MKIKYWIICFSLNFSFIHAQTTSQVETVYVDFKFEFIDSCGNPLMESMQFTHLEGKVTEIIDGNSIHVKLNTGELKQINLVAVEIFDGKQCFRDSAISMLKNLILDKYISISTHSTDNQSKIYSGVVYYNSQDINRRMLESGMAKFKQPEPYNMSHYDECAYQILERRARKKQTGLWKYTSK